jgi:hypothetical protein
MAVLVFQVLLIAEIAQDSIKTPDQGQQLLAMVMILAE